MSEEIDQTSEALRTIEESKAFLILFILALVLSYLAVDIQERQLLCAETEKAEGCEDLPDPCPIQITSGLLSLWGLAFFYSLGKQTASIPAADPKTQKRNEAGWLAGLLSLIAGMLRLWAVLDGCLRSDQTPPSPQTNQR